jgi:hypothetical protein
VAPLELALELVEPVLELLEPLLEPLAPLPLDAPVVPLLDGVPPVDEVPPLAPPVEVEREAPELALVGLPRLLLDPVAPVLPAPGCWQRALAPQNQPEGQSALVLQWICVPSRLRSHAEIVASTKARPKEVFTTSAPRRWPARSRSLPRRWP